VVQLSDVPHRPHHRAKVLEHVVEKANAQKPDAIVITGRPRRRQRRVAPAARRALAKLKARHGVYFVTGNHEYYSGVDEWLTELERLGIRVFAQRARLPRR
jgi:predicted MPP superfamily phosphohydrolase